MLYEVAMERSTHIGSVMITDWPVWLSAENAPEANAPEVHWLLPLAEAARAEAEPVPAAAAESAG